MRDFRNVPCGGARNLPHAFIGGGMSVPYERYVFKHKGTVVKTTYVGLDIEGEARIKHLENQQKIAAMELKVNVDQIEIKRESV